MHLLFCLCHISISRSDNFIDFRDTLSAVSKGRNRLCSADFKNLFNSRNTCSGENRRIHSSVPVRRGDHDNLLTSRYPGRDQIHQHRRRIGGRPVRHVHPDFFNRAENLSQHRPVLFGNHDIAALLRFMIAADVLCRLPENSKELFFYLGKPFLIFLGRHSKALQIHVIKLFGISE